MKYKIILFFLLTSCINNTYVGKSEYVYSAKGFAKIENQPSSDSDNFYVFHNKLKPGTKIRVTNPTNGKSLEKIIKKKVDYNNFYKVLISEDFARELNLDFNFPYVEISEIKINKTFIAKKAITENVEKKM